MADWIKTARKLARASDDLGGARSDIDVALLNVSISDFPTKDLQNRFKALRRRLGRDGAAGIAGDIRVLLQDFMLTLRISSRTIQAWCPSCGSLGDADVLCSYHDHWEYYGLPAMFFSVSITRVLRCRRYGILYAQREKIENLGKTETILDFLNPDADGLPSIESTFEYWLWHSVSPEGPTSQPERHARQVRERPAWIVNLPDEALKTLLDETYSALKSGLLSLSTMGTRAVLDRAMQLLGASAADGFVGKLDDLESQGKITPQQKADLVVLTDAGSAASHRGWRPEPEDISTILEATEELLRREFTRPEATARLKGRVPPKPTRVVRLDSKRPGQSPRA